METHHQHSHQRLHSSMYRRLLFMAALSFVAMYVLMYAMVDEWENVIPNVNQLYMAGLMTMPMVVIEIILMGNMYKAKKINIAIVVFSLFIGSCCFLLIRKQVLVSDRQFLKSMIPHHAAAVLMVRAAKITDPEVKILADSIIAAQEREIRFMKQKLKEMND